MTVQVFEVPSTTNSAFVLLLLLPLLIGLGLAAVFWPRQLRVELSASELSIRGSIYGRSVPRSVLRSAEARIVNLAVERELVPTLRTNGVSLPNYRVGWFRLADRERALCFLTRTDSVLYLPTTDNYVLLVSTSNPDELLKAVQAAN